MAHRTLKEIVQFAAKRLLMPVPETIVDNSDPGVMQYLALLQEEVDDSLSDHDWSELIKPWTITSTGTNYTAAPLPSDYGRMLKSGGLVRSMNRVDLIGPVSSTEWLKLTMYGSTLVTGAWRLFGGKMDVYGIGSGDTVQTEYVSRNFVLDADGVTSKADWTADTDTPLIDDTIFRLGLVWRWKRAKGLDFSREYDAYNAQKEQIIAHDRGLRSVPTARSFRTGLPDNFWPGSVVVTP